MGQANNLYCVRWPWPRKWDKAFDAVRYNDDLWQLTQCRSVGNVSACWDAIDYDGSVVEAKVSRIDLDHLEYACSGWK